MLPYGHVEDQAETWEFEITTNARLGINTCSGTENSLKLASGGKIAVSSICEGADGFPETMGKKNSRLPA